MGLSVNQIRFLALTARKADVELDITNAANRKRILASEMADLASEYNAKLNATKVSYFANGQYNQVNYAYLMGYGKNFLPILGDGAPIKNDNNMILTDYSGAVVLAGDYVSAILSVLGTSAMDAYGRGSTFSQDEIPDMLAHMCPGFDVEVFESVMEGEDVPAEYAANVVNLLSNSDTGQNTVVDYTAKATEQVQTLLDFYLPIFRSAAANGWTSEYDSVMAQNPDYVADAIGSGIFCLVGTDNNGQYDPGISTDYYVTCGEFSERSDASEREEVTAWYNAEKARIAEKETIIDIQIQDWSTELEAINAELESLQSLIDDATSSFEWGG